MTKYLTGLLLICLAAKHLQAQNRFEVSIPETYELSNIILALTAYGRSDGWEVQKNTAYYNEVIAYFAPVNAHPLLQKVNYSRALWESYLSFRTDAAAYVFDGSGKLARTNAFYANKGQKPFDAHLDLIQDFIQKSNYREFYKAHLPLYEGIVANYADYYMLDAMRTFLERESGRATPAPGRGTYKVILSPLAGRMNCHRDIDSITTADFPSLSTALIDNNAAGTNDQAQRAVEIHTVFSEMDHGYVNPVTELFRAEVGRKFKNEFWDRASGYKGLSCFNEYMTWALYDIFVKEQFPAIADSISTQWHYQNASRGFFASSLFASQLMRLHSLKKPGETLKDLYPKLLDWIAETQSGNKELQLLLPKADSIYMLQKNGQITLDFSTALKRKFGKISCIIMKRNNGGTNERTVITIRPKDIIKWNSDSSIMLRLKVPYNEFVLVLNWWGCRYPALSDRGIMLAPQSYLLLKKAAEGHSEN